MWVSYSHLNHMNTDDWASQRKFIVRNIWKSLNWTLSENLWAWEARAGLNPACPDRMWVHVGFNSRTVANHTDTELFLRKEGACHVWRHLCPWICLFKVILSKCVHCWMWSNTTQTLHSVAPKTSQEQRVRLFTSQHHYSLDIENESLLIRLCVNVTTLL